MVPAPLPEEPGVELPGDVDVPDEPGVVVDGLFSLGLLGAELPVPYEPLPVPYEPVLLAPPTPMDPLVPLVELGAPVLGLAGLAVPLGSFTPPPIVPVLVAPGLVPVPDAPEFIEPVPVSPCATSRHAPKAESVVATEARAAALTDTAGGSAGR